MPTTSSQSLDVTPVFFDAIAYPHYARPDYFIQKQKQSGWSKGVYLTALNEKYHAYLLRLRLNFNARTRREPLLTIEDVKLTVPKPSGTEEWTFDNKLLEELHQAIQSAWFIDQPKKTHTPYQVLSLVEKALLFIRQEFQEQTGQNKKFDFRPRTKTYFTYLIAQDGPFFDFPTFKATVRELILTSTRPQELKKILTPYHKICIEIVRLWNDDISQLERRSNESENRESPERALVEFQADTLSYSWWNEESHFQLRPHQLFLNQDFAYYAANIANLISSDLLHNKETHANQEQKKFLNDFVRGIRHLANKYENETCITNILEGKKLEGPFRDFFWRWLDGLEYKTNIEPRRGRGHIDLKVEHDSINTQIIEFKGWWNPDKELIILQLFDYLTEFESNGSVFMINHSRKPILATYKKIVTGRTSGYIAGSWRPSRYQTTDFHYYHSEHKFNGSPKIIHHFIFNVHHTRRLKKKK